jgi:hypothetical protein
MNTRTPLILAIVLLVLPVMYVGSYFAMVVPGGIPEDPATMNPDIEFPPTHYRFADTTAEYFFWPLERIDRRLRPAAWDNEPLRGPFPPYSIPGMPAEPFGLPSTAPPAPLQPVQNQ